MSPRTKDQNELRRQRSMERIEEAALELFGHKGYGNTSISAIAQGAGVSKGLLYNYYENKAALLRALTLHAAEKGEAIMNAEFFNDKKPTEVLLKMVDFMVDAVSNNKAYWKLLTSLGLQDDVVEEVGDFLRKKSTSYIHMLTPIFKKLGYPNPEAQCILFSASMDGIFLQYISLRNKRNLDLSIQSIKETFCKPYNLING